MFNNMVRFTDSVYATYKGTGSKQITLPAGMDAAYVTLTYKGTDEFELGTLDKTGQPTYDGLVGVGNYKGSTVIGLFEEPSSTLYIEGEGNWTITV